MLKERIQILLDGNVISPEAAKFTDDVIDLLGENTYEESKMEMFTTHLAMATARVQKGEPVSELEDSIWQQVQDDSQYQNARKLFEEIKDLCPVQYPEGESRFLVMHLCNMIQDPKGKKGCE